MASTTSNLHTLSLLSSLTVTHSMFSWSALTTILKHFLLKQFFVNDLDSALRIAKSGDTIFIEEGSYSGRTLRQQSGNMKMVTEINKAITLVSCLISIRIWTVWTWRFPCQCCVVTSKALTLLWACQIDKLIN